MPAEARYPWWRMKPLWLWAQGIIVVGTLAGMVIAVIKLNGG